MGSPGCLLMAVLPGMSSRCVLCGWGYRCVHAVPAQCVGWVWARLILHVPLSQSFKREGHGLFFLYGSIM